MTLKQSIVHSFYIRFEQPIKKPSLFIYLLIIVVFIPFKIEGFSHKRDTYWVLNLFVKNK